MTMSYELRNLEAWIKKKTINALRPASVCEQVYILDSSIILFLVASRIFREKLLVDNKCDAWWSYNNATL